MSDIPAVTEPPLPEPPPLPSRGEKHAAPAIQTEDEARIASLTPQRGLEIGKILTEVPRDEKGEPIKYCDLGPQLDEQLYSQLESIYRVIALVAADNPADPNITRLQMMVKKLFGDEEEPSEFRRRAQQVIEERDKLKKAGKYKIQDDKMRIFHTEEELILALGALDIDEILTAEAFGQIITNGGREAVGIMIDKNFNFEHVLKKALPSLGERVSDVAANIKKALEENDKKRLKQILTSLGSTAGGAILGAAGGAVVGTAGGPPGAAAGLKTGAILGTALGNFIGTSVAVGWDFFVGSKGESFTISIECPQLGSRVITSYIEHSGRMGSSSTEKLTSKVMEAERLRHEIYYAFGLDIRDPAERVKISLDYETLDPGSNTISLGAGMVRFNTERQLALRNILDSMGKRSLVELSPEQRLEAILRSYDAAAGKMCEGVATQVIKELTAQGQTDRTSQAAALTTAATELEQGKRTLTPVDERKIAKKKAAQQQAEERLKFLEGQKAELDRINGEITTKEDEKRRAESILTGLKKRYETPLSQGNANDTLLSRLEQQASTDFSEYTRLVGRLADLNNQISRNTTDLGDVQRRLAELEKLLPYVEKLTVDDINPKTGNKFSNQDELDKLKISLRMDWQGLQSRMQTLVATINGKTAEKNTKEAELAQAKTRHQESKEAFEKARKEIDDAQNALDLAESDLKALIERRNKILQDHFGMKDPTKPPTSEAIIKKLNAARTKVTDLTAEIAKLEENLARFKEGRGEATAEDKETAKAFRLVAGLLQEAKYNELMGRLWEGKDSVADLRSHDQWVQLFFGTLMGEERAIAERVLTRALMVETAVEVFGLNPQEFFGADYAVLQQNYREMEELGSEIGNLRAVRKEDWQQESRRLQGELAERARANYALLEKYFDRITPLITRNRMETVEYAGVLVDRIRDHAIKENVFGLSYGIREKETGVRKRGETAETPYGRIRVEPPEVVNGVEQNHGSVIWETPPHHKTSTSVPYEMHATVRIDIKKPKSAAATDALSLTFSIFLDANLYNGLPNVKPRPIIGWPEELLNEIYDSTGGKKKQEEIGMGRYITFSRDKTDFAEVTSDLETLKLLGNLDSLVTQSVGQLFTMLDREKREQYFGKFATATIELKDLGGALVDRVKVERDSAGEILVEIPVIKQKSTLSEFINKFENYYKIKIGMNIDTPLDATQRGEMQQLLDQFLKGIGQEALQSLQRY